MKKLIPFLILIFGQLLIVSSQSNLYNTYRIDEYIDKLDHLRSIEDEDTVCKTEFMLWREHLRDLSKGLIITKKERRKFLKYFKAETNNGYVAHKNVKKFKRRRNAIVAGTIVIVAGTVALIVEDPSDPFWYGGGGAGALYDDCYCCNSEQRNNTYHRFLVQAIEEFHTEYMDENTYY